MFLLYLYEGAWIDATVFVTDTIKESYFQQELFSIKFGESTKDPSDGRWTTFCIFLQPSNHLIYDTLVCHMKYWKYHDLTIHYVMFDHFIALLVSNDTDYKELIDGIEPNNSRVFCLLNKLNDIYDNSIKNNKDTIFYKLSMEKLFERKS